MKDAPPIEATTAPGMWRRIAAWIRLPHPAAILVVLGATSAFAILFSGGSIDPRTLARLLIAMLGGQLAIGAVNEIADRALDGLSKPWKPIPAGLITVRQASMLAIGGIVVMTAAGATFGLLPLLLLVAGTSLGLAYDLWLKRGPWAWAPYALALPLLPVWVMACLGIFDPGALLLFPLGGPGTAGVYLAQSAADAETDRAAGLDNLGARLGARRTAMLAAALVGGTVVLAVLVAWFAPALAVDPRAVAMWAVPSGALVITGATLAARGSDQAIRRCFVPLALALAVIGFGWVRAGR